MRARATAVGAVLAATAALVGPAPLAAASGSAPTTADAVLFYARNVGGQAQLVRHDTDGTDAPIVTKAASGPTSYRISRVTASPTLDRIAYELDTDRMKGGVPSQVASEIDVVDYDGSAKTSVTYATGSDTWRPSAWSRDGRDLWVTYGGTRGIYVWPAATGHLELLPGSAAYVNGRPDPTDAAAFYGIAPGGNLYRVHGSSRTLVAGGAAGNGGISGYAVAPDGATVAVTYDNFEDYPFTDLLTSNGTLFRELAGSGDTCAAFRATAFSLDGSEVYGDAQRCTETDQVPAVGRLAVDGSDNEVPAVVTGTDNGTWPALAPVDTTPPPPPSAFALHLGGDRPDLSWTNPTDPTFSHMMVERYDGTTTSGTPTVGTTPWHATAFTDEVTLGATYTYLLYAVDGAGNVSAALSRTMQALQQPRTHAPTLASIPSPGPGFPVIWGSGLNPETTRYTVQWRRAGTATWSKWLAAETDPAGWFGRRGVPTIPHGGRYRFRAITVDAYGNPSHWQQAASVVPYDQARAGFVGSWWAARNVNDWRGAIRGASQRGDAAVIRLTGRQFAVIGDRCARCGALRVYVDGSLMGTFGAHKATLAHREMLAAVNARIRGAHWIRIVDAPNAHGWQLHLDAVAVLR